MPVESTDNDGNPVTDDDGNPVYEKNADGTYVCNPDTVPQRVLAYRAENGLAADVKVPVDAVTASGSGLDPEICVANARLQAPRVAKSAACRSTTCSSSSTSTPTAVLSGSSVNRVSTCSS